MRETRFDLRCVSLSLWFAVMDASELRMGCVSVVVASA